MDWRLACALMSPFKQLNPAFFFFFFTAEPGPEAFLRTLMPSMSALQKKKKGKSLPNLIRFRSSLIRTLYIGHPDETLEPKYTAALSLASRKMGMDGDELSSRQHVGCSAVVVAHDRWGGRLEQEPRLPPCEVRDRTAYLCYGVT